MGSKVGAGLLSSPGTPGPGLHSVSGGVWVRSSCLETWFHLFQEEETDIQRGPPPDPQDWLGPGSRCLVVQLEPNTQVSHRSLHAGCF